MKLKKTTEYLEQKYGLNLTPITNNGQASKRFDFVVKGENVIYGIEVNFYSGSGSKLNEVARSYKEIAIESRKIENFCFVWITDGLGWQSTKRNLKEAFDQMDTLYNLNDLKNGALTNLVNGSFTR
jgi:type II restriction enzyme